MYKLLIVEDEPLIRRGIKTLIDFNALNISECLEAENGQEGLELFIAHAPDLVLLDINLPLLNGIALAERIKAQSPRTKIAMLTGYDYFDYAVSALRLGVDDYVLKPVGKAEITQILFKLVEKLGQENLERALKEPLMSAPENDERLSLGYKDQIEALLSTGLYDVDFSLTRLAHDLSLSPNYLSLIFKTYFGQPFQIYILEKRLQAAKLMLLTGQYKIYEIAQRVGFEDVNYFSTRFKKFFGVSPKQFVENVRKGHGY